MCSATREIALVTPVDGLPGTSVNNGNPGGPVIDEETEPVDASFALTNLNANEAMMQEAERRHRVLSYSTARLRCPAPTTSLVAE
jgi:hypothetical protein